MSDQIDRANELAEKAERQHLQKFCKIRPLAPASLSVRTVASQSPKNAEKWLSAAPVVLNAKPFTSISKKATADD
ncbi:Uncharacterised protein [Mannheimia haemolytica]|uniref:Uncharacterized protein n=1 Tax=Mannheimia haemolytica TaxID=75985 RepID=A0A378MZG4_MANHA|nr:Uncharacterised protein [Mannheimia haemolytica]